MIQKGLKIGDFFQEGESWYVVEGFHEKGYISRRVSEKEKEDMEAARKKKAVEEADRYVAYLQEAKWTAEQRGR